MIDGFLSFHSKLHDTRGESPGILENDAIEYLTSPKKKVDLFDDVDTENIKIKLI